MRVCINNYCRLPLKLISSLNQLQTNHITNSNTAEDIWRNSGRAKAPTAIR